MNAVVIANGTVVDTETGIARPWILPADVPELANLVHENAVDLCVIDPLAAFVATAVDTHRDAAVRSMLLPLSTMARHEKCAVIGVRHHRKGGALDARDAGTGSVAFTAAARIEWVAGRDPEDPGRRVLAVAKTNIAAVPPSRLYRLVAAEGEFDTVAVRWEGTSTVTANELASGPVSAEERSELDEAVEFLREVLRTGPVEANVVKRHPRGRISDKGAADAERRNHFGSGPARHPKGRGSGTSEPKVSHTGLKVIAMPARSSCSSCSSCSSSQVIPEGALPVKSASPEGRHVPAGCRRHHGSGLWRSGATRRSRLGGRRRVGGSSWGCGAVAIAPVTVREGSGQLPVIPSPRHGGMERFGTGRTGSIRRSVRFSGP